MRVRVEGLKELEAQFARLSASASKAAARRAAIKAMEPMRVLAERLAPKDTGQLAASIEVSAKATGAGAQAGKSAYAKVMRAGGSKAEARSALQSASAEAARSAPNIELFMGPARGKTKQESIKQIAQEFGTAKMAASPYMRPAWDQDHAALLKRVIDNLRQELDKSIKRAQARKARTG